MNHDERRERIQHYQSLDLQDLLAIERDQPRDVDLLVTIGGHYMRERRLELTHAYYSRALEVDPNDGWTQLYFGHLGYVVSCFDEAETHYKRAIELLPDSACPHWCLGDLYAQMGYLSRTEEAYRRAVAIEPDNEDARTRLNQWLAEKPM